MAYASNHSHRAAHFGIRDVVARKLQEFRDQREKYQEYFQTLDTLSRASDRELADIGIHREEIADIARNHAGL